MGTWRDLRYKEGNRKKGTGAVVIKFSLVRQIFIQTLLFARWYIVSCYNVYVNVSTQSLLKGIQFGRRENRSTDLRVF